MSTHVLIGMAIVSVVLFVASLIGVPYFLCRVPSDYFSRRERAALGLTARRRPAWQLTLRILSNVVGWLLIAVGLAMIVLPGQGLLTIVVGLLLVDFPGKRRFERWIIARPAVLRAINALRHRAGRPPIEPRASWLPPPKT